MHRLSFLGLCFSFFIVVTLIFITITIIIIFYYYFGLFYLLNQSYLNPQVLLFFFSRFSSPSHWERGRSGHMAASVAGWG